MIHKLIAYHGAFTEFPPADGKHYTLKEMQEAVGGLIEIVTTRGLHELGDCIMVVNEEGKLKNLPRNTVATVLARLFPGDYIAGPAILCSTGLIE